MKKQVILLSACVIMICALVPVLAEQNNTLADNTAKAETKAVEKADVKVPAANAVNKPAEAVEVKKIIKLKSLDEVTRQNDRVMSKWLSTNFEDKAPIAKAVQDEALAELRYLREIAEKEGAKNTVTSIDQLINMRENNQAKMDKIVFTDAQAKKKAELEKRKQGILQHMRETGQMPKPEPRDKNAKRPATPAAEPNAVATPAEKK
jgi:hypothetical protein